MAAATPRPTSHVAHAFAAAPQRPLGRSAPRRLRLQTGHQGARRERHVLLRIFLGFVPDAQLNGIDVQPNRQLVHRLLERQQPDRLARRTHGIGHRQIERRDALAGEPVGRGVERARRVHDRLGIFVGPCALRERLVGDGGERAVALGAQPHALDRGRAVGRDIKHLLAGQHDPHRPGELARGERRQDGIGIDRQLAAEAAADIFGDHLDLVGRKHERAGDRLVGALDEL